MSALNPQFVAQVRKICAALDSIDYFQLLRIPYDAIDEEIRDAYHKQARAFHPDRYNHFGDAALVEDLTLVAKRITEAYVVLRDEHKRTSYLANIQGEARSSSLRFGESHEGEHRSRQEEARGKTAQGRQMLEQALQEHERGDLKAAVQSLKMALLYEKDNATFSALLAEWEAEAE